MNRHPAVLASLLLLAAFLAGCTATDDIDESPRKPVPGTIEGRVLDTMGLPIPAATVALLASDRSATTDTGGAFRMEGVTPGPAVLTATKPGYSARTARGTVEGGEVLTVDFRLVPAPRIEPHGFLLTFEGVIACGLPGGVTCGLLADELPQHHYEVEPGLSAILLELEWTPPVDAVAAPLRLDAAAATANACGEVYASTTGPNSLALVVAEGFPIAGGHQCALVLPGEGVLLQQGYTLYVTMFYHMAPPPGYSAVP